jgi:hypothetical protein
VRHSTPRGGMSRQREPTSGAPLRDPLRRARDCRIRPLPLDFARRMAAAARFLTECKASFWRHECSCRRFARLIWIKARGGGKDQHTDRLGARRLGPRGAKCTMCLAARECCVVGLPCGHRWRGCWRPWQCRSERWRSSNCSSPHARGAAAAQMGLSCSRDQRRRLGNHDESTTTRASPASGVGIRSRGKMLPTRASSSAARS